MKSVKKIVLNAFVVTVAFAGFVGLTGTAHAASFSTAAASIQTETAKGVTAQAAADKGITWHNIAKNAADAQLANARVAMAQASSNGNHKSALDNFAKTYTSFVTANAKIATAQASNKSASGWSNFASNYADAISANARAAQANA